ncbi:MAG: hypothetical protein NZ811_04705 [Gammaproteobacteria bacterium]|nr:hypothetical protein [Gammaproteobacteria bacterium]
MLKGESKIILNDLNQDKKHQEKQKNKNAGDKLIDLVKGKCELFSDFEGKAYTRFAIEKHKEVYAIKSQEFIDYLHLWYYRETQRAPSKASLETAISSLSAVARFDGPKESVHIRVAQIEQTIYIDLCNDKWQVAKVSFEGIEVLNDSPVAFTRNNKMKSLPTPTVDSDYNEGNAKEDIKLILKHINIKDDQLPLLAGWLLMSIQKSKAAYPVLIINGPAGSGKTTACEMLRELVDPNAANLVSQPKTSELRVVGAENHVLGFDNLSKVNPSFSDALCKIATGDNQVIRELYTTNSSFTVNIKKPIMLNGIPELAKRPDLVSRSVKLTLHKIRQIKTSEQAWYDFNQDRPRVFNALLYGCCIAHATQENIKINNMTRMADFCKFATASHLAFGWSKNQFMDAYRANVKSAYVDSLESSMFTTALMKMFERESVFKGRPIQLLEHLEYKMYASERTTRSSKWPKTPKGVMEILDRSEDALAAIGIDYEKYKDRTNKTFIKLELDKSLIDETSNNLPTFKDEPEF